MTSAEGVKGLSFEQAASESVELVNAHAAHAAHELFELRETVPSWGYAVDRVVTEYVDGLTTAALAALKQLFRTILAPPPLTERGRGHCR